MADAPAENKTGVMLALYPAPDVAKGLVVDDGLAADDLHVTLIYLGNVGEDLDESDRVTILDVAGDIAERKAPLSGKLHGLITWGKGGDRCNMRAVDAQGLNELRTDLARDLDAAGIKSPSEHGFTPHLAVSYGSDELDPLPETPVTFDALCLSWGADITRLPFTGTEMKGGGAMDIQVEHKSLARTEVKVVDAEQGIIECVVSVTGLLDQVNDIIEPGAYTKTLAARKPKMVWSHDWDKPIGVTKSIDELMPGDPRIPKHIAEKGGGALLVKSQFIMDTQLGREAYAIVKAFGEDAEFSIGYNVPAGSATKGKDGVRHIKSLDLFEYSPVLFGAMPHAKTVSLKSALAHEMEMLDDTSDDGTKDVFTGMASPVATVGMARPHRHPFVDRKKRGKCAVCGIAEGEHGSKALDIAVSEWACVSCGGSEPMESKDASALPCCLDCGADMAVYDLQEADFDELTDDEVEVLTKALDLPGAQEDERPEEWTADTESVVTLELPPMPDVDDPDFDLKMEVIAALAEGELAAENFDDAITFAVTVTSGVPDGAVVVSGETHKIVDFVNVETKVATMVHEPLGKPGNGENWVERAGQLPAYVQHIAKDLHTERGMTLSHAIATAISRIKVWAAGGDNVKPDTRAKAAAALAEWETLKAKNKAKKAGRAVADAGEKSLSDETDVPVTTPADPQYIAETDDENTGGDAVEVEPRPEFTLTFSDEGAETAEKAAEAAVEALESKVGRVLSTSNAAKLKRALEDLVHVLRVAGALEPQPAMATEQAAAAPAGGPPQPDTKTYETISPEELDEMNRLIGTSVP